MDDKLKEKEELQQGDAIYGDLQKLPPYDLHNLDSMLSLARDLAHLGYTKKQPK